MYKAPNKRRKRKVKKVIVKIVDFCKTCNKQLRKNNKHHFFCQECWEENEIKKGNLSLIGGLKKGGRI